jgi:branched-chain amino acid transport system permease protein
MRFQAEWGPVANRFPPFFECPLPGESEPSMQWQFWIIQTLNSVAFGGLLFMLSSGFSLIFGLMRIPNLAHGGFFMLGAYFGYSLLIRGFNFWPAAIVGGLGVGLIGVVLERFLLRRLAGNEQGQVLVTLGISFIIADLCLVVWTGDPMPLAAPPALRPPLRVAGYAFPTYRLVVLAISLVAALGLYLLMERTRLGAMIRAGVDDMEMARGVGIPVSRLFTTVFLLGATLAGIGGVLGGPILNAYPGLDADMLPLALIVVILGGAGSLLGAFVGSFIVGFIYNFGIALVPDLAYFVLFLPMVLVLVFLPQGLFGRVQL